ncbi:hypothetical protein CHELA1G11_10988 [Hyphomicrobiales bacterium]|nr:hypothetical protein CHELA1G11_10988 [Hyphomicrobiales bacterium]CAH1670905.1 hypothetical protein CHELA1G2_13320 [Hyphomicrobiales bacterium]
MRVPATRFDPLSRRSSAVSQGAAFLIPHTPQREVVSQLAILHGKGSYSPIARGCPERGGADSSAPAQMPPLPQCPSSTALHPLIRFKPP